MDFIINGDPSKYTKFVETHPKGHVLQTLEWAKVKEDNWRPIYVTVEEKGAVKASMLLLLRQLPMIRKNIIYSPRGPVCDMHDFDTLKFLMDNVRKLARKNNAIMLKIDPDISIKDQIVANNLKKLGFKQNMEALNFEGIQPRFVFRLDITPSLEELLMSFHPKTRYNIRLAQRRGVKIRIGKREDLKEFHRIMEITGLRDGFVVRSLDYFEKMYDSLEPRGYLELALAEYEGKTIAGIICLFCGTKCWYLYGASSNEHRNVMPNYLLQWEMIKRAKERGCTLYDFRGVSGDLNPDNPLYGLYRFKKGFNGEFTEFIGEFDMVLSPFWYTVWQKGIPIFRNIRRKITLMLKKSKFEDKRSSTKDELGAH
ncbi:lipid II:glycine glycyltransferase FemX [Thermosediminibacter oceani]|uniref:Methicillin resistance protein n=1 Tax=Thermosediminibacter oceani (strain ATCC BAA-1034 / DSM 16646 / JW/IW-1228P) TaxID=555079 RepID=D9S0Q7_THEOJ|nr:peptidoglycan bridge formation glycyltransferase FemA/FemB family protein [Thermosediminibacter oceani]ADL07071.1 Methicillin resistance protein [Thermosediminibacter oceani DSM 16646]